MAELQNGNITAALRRYSNHRGVLSPSVADEISPICRLDEIPYRQDGVAWGPAATSVAASVGNLGTIGLNNDTPDTDRNCLLITQLIIMGQAAAQTIFLGWGIAAVAGGFQLMTAEYDKLGSPVLLADTVANLPGRVNGNNGIAGSRILRLTSLVSCAANALVVIPCEIVVPPGLCFYMETSAANVAIQGGFSGRFWRQVG